MHRQFFSNLRKGNEIEENFLRKPIFVNVNAKLLLLLLLRFLMIGTFRFHVDRPVILSNFGSIDCVP